MPFPVRPLWQQKMVLSLSPPLAAAADWHGMFGSVGMSDCLWLKEASISWVELDPLESLPWQLLFASRSQPTNRQPLCGWSSFISSIASGISTCVLKILCRKEVLPDLESIHLAYVGRCVSFTSIYELHLSVGENAWRHPSWRNVISRNQNLFDFTAIKAMYRCRSALLMGVKAGHSIHPPGWWLPPQILWFMSMISDGMQSNLSLSTFAL